MYWIHSKHHEKRQPKFLDTYYGHILESVFQGLGFLLPFALKMTDPSDAAAALIILNIKGMMRHDERTGHLIDNNHHLLHHLESRNNFGEPWLDVLFGTFKAPTTQFPQLKLTQ
jgi:sterol desaturase/sphingolipid hydroxylase (fatty acid hydroxylase superfamily)